MNAAKKLVTFVKKETVLCIAGLLAVVSMFIICLLYTSDAADE